MFVCLFGRVGSGGAGRVKSWLWGMEELGRAGCGSGRAGCGAEEPCVSGRSGRAGCGSARAACGSEELRLRVEALGVGVPISLSFSTLVPIPKKFHEPNEKTPTFPIRLKLPK